MGDRSRLKGIGLKLVSIVAGLMVGAVILEAGVRTFLPQYSPAHEIQFRFDEVRKIFSGPRNRVMRQTKNTGDYDVEVRFNAAGFRDNKNVSNALTDDWVLVGDSFSFGWGVSVTQRFGDLLDANLKHKVYNLSAPGNVDHYAMLLDYADRAGADTSRIIVGLCVENDVLNYESLHDNRHRTLSTPLLDKVKRAMGNSSAAWRALTTLVHTNGWLRGSATAFGVIKRGDKPDRLVPSRAAMESTVRRLKRVAEDRETVVLLIPSRQIYLDSTRAAAKALHESLVIGLQSAGIRVVDPLEAFEQSAHPLREYHFAYDGHWNSRGHEVAAAALVAELAGKGVKTEAAHASQ